MARLAMDRRELVDAKFAVKAVEDHIALFGKPPRAYAYDRAGHSEKNVKRLKELGVKEVGLGPPGKDGMGRQRASAREAGERTGVGGGENWRGKRAAGTTFIGREHGRCE